MWATRSRCPSEAAYPQPSPPPRSCPCRRAIPPSASGCSSPGAGGESCKRSSRSRCRPAPRGFTRVLANACARLGAEWFATPSPQWTCTTYSLPVSRRTCLRSSFGHSPARFYPNFFIRRSPPQLFTAAARTGLRPAPESRSRGADPHLSRSFATVLAHVELLPLPCSTLSSMNASFLGSRSSCAPNHSWRRFKTSGRCCSSACAVFLNMISCRSKKRQITDKEKRSPQLVISRSWISNNVMSG